MNVPTIDIQKTGANIKTLRKAAGIKVKDVADTLGVSTQGSCQMASWNSTPHHRQPCDIGSDAGYQDR